jgi:non-ribosomal peptide synthase protein (TIGR01720 family)
VLKYLGSEEARARLSRGPRPQLAFNYLGQTDRGATSGPLALAGESPGPTVGPDNPLLHPLAVNAWISGGRLTLDWTFCPRSLSHERVQALSEAYERALVQLVEHCLAPDAGGYTPSDFPLSGLDSQGLESLLGQITRKQGGEP